jgi:pimeloyl-ACP methyl ester carboxylesterase
MQLEVHHHPAAQSPQQRPPLLLVHGAWHAAWCWDVYFVPYFTAAGFSVSTLSLRGHGASDGRQRLRWTSIADYVRDVETTIARDLPQPPFLIGHSMGGAVVQKYLERHQLPGAILLASVPPAGVLATTLRIARRHFKEFLLANLTMRLYPLVSTPALAQEAFFSTDMPADHVLKYFQQIQDESYRVFLDMLVLNLPKPRRVTTPVLVLGGAQDRIFSPAEVQATARAYGTTATIFENMAHDLMLEAGWRTVADTMLAWITARHPEAAR